MKKGLVGVLRALAVLAAIWGVLAAVALVAGVVSLDGSRPGAVADSSEETEGDDDGGPAEGEPDPVATTDRRDGGSTDAGTGEQATAEPEDLEPLTVPRWTVCEAAVRRPSLAVAQIVGSPAPEVIVGCDDVVHVLVVVDGRPARVATFDAARSEDAALAMHAAAPAAGDVDGDSLPDLVLPFWQSSRDGSARGGKLYLVRADGTGAFDDARLLGPIAAVSVELAQLDGQAGLDIVAMNRGSSLSRRPSEAWVYTGGAAPVRSAVLRSGLGGNAVVLADLDRDTHLDVVSVVSGEPRVDVFYGDGTGRFPRSGTVAIPDAMEASAVDLDGDGATDVLVRGDALHLLQAGPEGSLEPRPVGGPGGLTQVRAVDVNGDERLDLVGLSEGGLVVSTQVGELVFAEAEPRRPGPVVLQRLAVADLTGDGELRGAALGRAGAEESPWELLLLPSLADPSPLQGSSEASPVPDAPLVLRMPLE